MEVGRPGRNNFCEGFDFKKVLHETEKVDFRYHYKESDLVLDHSIQETFINSFDICDVNPFTCCIPQYYLFHLKKKWFNDLEVYHIINQGIFLPKTWMTEINEGKSKHQITAGTLFKSGFHMFKSKRILEHKGITLDKKSGINFHILNKFRGKNVTAMKMARPLTEANNCPNVITFGHTPLLGPSIQVPCMKKFSPTATTFNKDVDSLRFKAESGGLDQETDEKCLLDLEKNLDELLLL